MQRRLLLAALALTLGCAPQAPPPAPPVAPAPAQVAVPEASAESKALAARYAAVEERLLGNQLLRTDGGGEDTPFTDAMLARAFLSVAFQQEFAGGEMTTEGQGKREAIPLERWEKPIRVSLQIGASVPPDQAAADRVAVASYLARLARLTGLSIALDEARPNFFIHIASVDERAALGPVIARQMPGLTEGQMAAALRLPDTAYCQALGTKQAGRSAYARALVIIPSEHRPLMRQMCLHEEIAQMLGLPNDSNQARPSIFNDDQEFALLTRMDEMMLRILYSPDLTPGISANEARPVVEELARRLVDGEI